MGIVLVRVDDRLLHGQVMEAWLPFCKATCLIVANDEAKANPVQRLAIESCSSKGTKIMVMGIDESIDELKSKDFLNERIIMIIESLQDAMKLYRAGIRFPSLNVGNIHHTENNNMALSPSVFIDSEDVDYLKRFQEAGVKIDIRGVPSDKEVKINLSRANL